MGYDYTFSKGGVRGGGRSMSIHTCPEMLDMRLDKKGGQFSMRRLQ